MVLAGIISLTGERRMLKIEGLRLGSTELEPTPEPLDFKPQRCPFKAFNAISPESMEATMEPQIDRLVEQVAAADNPRGRTI